MNVLRASFGVCCILGMGIMGCGNRSGETPPPAYPANGNLQAGGAYGASLGNPGAPPAPGAPAGGPWAAPTAPTAPAGAPSGYGQPPPGYMPPPGAAPSIPSYPAPTGPGTPAAPAAVVRPCDPTETLALNTAIEGRAKVEARGMTPAGGLVCSFLPEGESSASASVILQPGLCYTALGQGLGVSELDVQLVIDPAGAGALAPLVAGMANTPLAVDVQTGPSAALGVGKDCYSPTFGPMPVPAKLVVKSRGGTGPAFGQLYSRKK